MTVEVTFKFPSFEAAKEFFTAAEKRIAPATVTVLETSGPITGDGPQPAPSGTPAEGATPTSEAPAKAKRGRPRKNEAASASVADSAPVSAPAVDAAAVAQPAGVASPSIDGVRAALRELNSKKGIAPCKAIFAEFNFQRVPELAQDKYAEVIKRCGELSA